MITLEDFKKDKLSKIRVGVLRGGLGDTHQNSLQTGRSILENLPNKYHGVDVFIDKKGSWYLSGMERSHDKVLSQIDIALNGLHGEYGADGQVQKILESFNVPYSGSKVMPSTLVSNKNFLNQVLKKEGIRILNYKTLNIDDADVQEIVYIFKSLTKPLVIKGLANEEIIQPHIVESFDDYYDVVMEFINKKIDLYIEEYKRGTEVTCGVVESLEPDKHYSLPIILQDPDKALHKDIMGVIKNIAFKIHKILGLRHYSKTDMVVGNDGIYISKINNLPELHPESSFHHSIKLSGSNMEEFLDHLVLLTLNK